MTVENNVHQKKIPKYILNNYKKNHLKVLGEERKAKLYMDKCNLIDRQAVVSKLKIV